MNVLGLFDGCSCGQAALNKAGIKYENYFASEIDKYAIKVTQHNFPKTIQLGNIYNINYSKLPKIDLILGGSPCTYWSIAKKDRETTSQGIGFDLFMQYVKAVEILKPKYFLYENNHSIHKDIKAAITEKLGVDFIMINSALVSAQNRKRCYWTNIPNINQPKNKNIFLTDILESGITNKNKSYCVSATEMRGNTLKGYIKYACRQLIFENINKPIRIGEINGCKSQKNRVYSVKGKSVCLSSNGGGKGAKTGLYKIDLPDGDYIIRKLTVKECCRLQTLPDNYFLDAENNKLISDSQAYKCIGNGWTIDVIAHILKNM